jgi:hypothetical protein
MKFMKTAEEWISEKEWSGNEDGDGNLLHYEWTVDDVKQIQLDAMKEGARRAAETVMNTMATGSPYENRLVMQSAILTTANNWTEKDL